MPLGRGCSMGYDLTPTVDWDRLREGMNMGRKRDLPGQTELVDRESAALAATVADLEAERDYWRERFEALRSETASHVNERILRADMLDDELVDLADAPLEDGGVFRLPQAYFGPRSV
jgi:hypothetical protein